MPAAGLFGLIIASGSAASQHGRHFPEGKWRQTEPTCEGSCLRSYYRHPVPRVTGIANFAKLRSREHARGNRRRLRLFRRIFLAGVTNLTPRPNIRTRCVA